MIFRLPWLDRDRRAALDAEERLFWAIVLSVAVSLSLVLALAAAPSLQLRAAADRRRRCRRRRRAWPHAAVCAFGPAAGAAGLTASSRSRWSCSALWRFFPPSEYIIGGKDPGVYVNGACRSRSAEHWCYHDPVVAAVPPFARDLFFPSHQRPDYYGTPLHGLLHHGSGRRRGRQPVSAPVSRLDRHRLRHRRPDRARSDGRRVGVLGVLAVYFAGARLAGRTAAAAAAALLTLHVIQVWFSRYPNAEVVMQALLFAALLANARAHVDGDRFFAPVAGVLLGLLLFLRFDAVLGIAGIAGGLALSAFDGRRPRVAFAGGRLPRSRRSRRCTCSGRCARTRRCRSSS